MGIIDRVKKCLRHYILRDWGCKFRQFAASRINALSYHIKKIFDIEIMRKNREIIMYLIFGGLTSLISIVLYTFFYYFWGLPNLVSNAVSLFFSILFAFVTNRRWVFEPTEASFFKECCSFYLSRLSTSLLEMLIMYIFVDVFLFNNLAIKIIATVVVIISNYVLSKFIVFKKS